MAQGIEQQTGPYMHMRGAVRPRMAGGKKYLIGIAGAYNACGLIGPEHNGVFVLNDTDKRVVTDRIAGEASGYFGPSQAQWEALSEFMRASDTYFLQLCAQSPRFRGVC